MTAAEQSPAQVLAAHLLAELVALGVRHIFVAPGARSQSLAIAAEQLAAAGKVQLTVRLDERSLGFQALGASVWQTSPTVVITTSGTAVANLHPAILEAHHSGVAMIVMTADRPHELRGVGANQTTNQVGIFNDAIRGCLDIAAPEDSEIGELAAFASQLAMDAWLLATGKHEASEQGAGPVQLNLAFREPLSSVEPNAANLPTTLGPIPELDVLRQPEWVDTSKKTLVIAGSQAGHMLSVYFEDVPVIAEPSSGARLGPSAILHYRDVLARHPELVSQIEQIVVGGKPTLARQVIALLRLEGVEVLVSEGAHGHFDVARNAKQVGDLIASNRKSDPAWLAAWQAADAEHRASTERELSASAAIDRRALIERVYESTGFEDKLVLGASRLIREAETWAPAAELDVWANRGLAGIDGTIATAIGISLNVSARSATTRALIGDLTFLHDAGSLALAATEPAANLQIVVGNDGGGSIFENLEVADQVESSTFDRMFRTKQTASIAGLANGYGWAHLAPRNIEELDAALATKGRVVIEVAL